MSLCRLAVAVAVAFLLPAASASAEVRSGSVSDPVDATLHQNVDGTSYRDQDIQRVTASYDTAGSITLTIYFLDPVPASAPDTLKAFFSAGASCDNYTTPAGYALMTVFTSSSKYDTAGMSVDGYEGSINGTRTLSADHRAITAQMTSPVLANRDYTCVRSISLHRLVKVPWHCDRYLNCSDTDDVDTDATDAFSIDAATPAFPTPAPEATTTPPATVTPTDRDRCVAARHALRKKQKQLKKLKAQRRSTHKRKRKAALAKKIDRTRLGIASTRTVIDYHC